MRPDEIVDVVARAVIRRENGRVLLVDDQGVFVASEQVLLTVRGIKPKRGAALISIEGKLQRRQLRGKSLRAVVDEMLRRRADELGIKIDN